jgi:hypothetical protein
MKNYIFTFLLLNSIAYSKCVEEIDMTGFSLLEKIEKSSNNYFIKDSDDRYISLHEIENINPATIYSVQVVKTQKRNKNASYIQYYDYPRIVKYIDQNRSTFNINNYHARPIGLSVEGRKLFAIYPHEIDKNKKTILMFGRHHGDEGSANWIIEGFLNNFFSSPEALRRYQVIVYPMINPDGTALKTRFNRNSRDLNRVWYQNVEKSKDEVHVIQSHLLANYIHKGVSPVITLDMHGSFTNDFIYRVDKNFINEDFYNRQQSFIDELSYFDNWQNGNFYDSNGDSKMARIYLARDFSHNALTHETRKEIPTSTGRSVKTLMDQGKAVLNTIMRLY